MDADALKDVPIFAGLSGKARRLAAEHCELIEVAAGKTLIEQGGLAHEFYIILEGEVDVFVAGEKAATLGAGDVMGEIGVLDTHKRTATVVTTAPTRLIVMDGRALRAIADTEEAVADEIRALIESRTAD
ncbi:MAG TPA: cyclic nucleotide-binding domain-containing protein [Acidimicrobiia bacterium]|nr:cyclic nucleotide-binding domain-containing protein [Acidimicrobiia bacterium]